MRLVKPKAELLAIYGVDDLPMSYKHPGKMIELAGRTCYKSEDKITENSFKTFTGMLCERGHHAMIEHSWQVRKYFGVRIDEYPSPFLRCKKTGDDAIVAGNVRAFVEAEVDNCLPTEKDYVYYDLCVPDDVLQKSIDFNFPEMIGMSARFICDRGVTHEMVRNRASFGQESTRWCNYDGGVAFIIPPWVDMKEGDYPQYITHTYPGKTNEADFEWFSGCLDSERHYLNLLKLGWKPEQARSKLGTDVKTEIIITASVKHWQHICAQREKGITGRPHPQMVEAMEPMFDEARKYIPFFDDEHMDYVFKEIKVKGYRLKNYFDGLTIEE